MALASAGTHLVQTLPTAGWARPLLHAFLETVAWAGLTLFAVACYSRQVELNSLYRAHHEISGYTLAFAAASALCGTVAIALYGERRSWWMALGMMLVCLSALVLCYWLFIKTAAVRPWVRRSWLDAFDQSLRIGSSFAIGFGMLVSGGMLAFSRMTRRKATWKTGLAASLVLVVIGYLALPGILFYTFDLALSSWPEAVYEFNTIQGAGIGAISGSAVGSAVLAIVSHWLRGKVQSRENTHGTTSPGHSATG